MKYKNVELVAADGRANELMVSVDFENPDEDDELQEEMEAKLNNLLESFTTKIYLDPVLPDYIQIRSHQHFAFDRQGVAFLKEVYDRLNESDINAKITVGIYIDGWFNNEDGSESCYNQDDISWEEFEANLKY
ncbi:hypothetical protein Ami103574_10935 [Aminipila butyrica]|uniref:Uncharacterized protein n=1 Tax=Aminipila butyrica TaxID=433296 RepID=A0A858BYM2_9FIRM|nr:hypothetical protein [Aminipila butyrica]QIB69804.1 hypothetical protein Ami103574_10935 [Aminipila butyrica]